MSWLSEMFGGSSNVQIQRPDPVQVQNYYDLMEKNNPTYYEQVGQYDDPSRAAKLAAKAAATTNAEATSTAAAAPPPAPTGGPDVALARLNEALGQGFESRFEPDTVASPFVQSALTAQRGKADDFIANMLKRGTLSETGRGKAVSALDLQTPGVRSKLTDLSTALLNADRANLTNLANTKRGQAQQTPSGTEYDPASAISELAQAGQGYAGSFGGRYNATLPPGDLFDVSGIGAAGGAVASPQNVSYDPYAVEGGKLSTGLGDAVTPPAADKKRRTSVF
jgi:hypothetical protein